MIDPLLLSVVKVLTFRGDQPLTNASGFFFERDERLFLVTSRHVLWDDLSNHFPDVIRIALHVDQDNIAHLVDLTIPLYRDEKAVWRQGSDSAGNIDIALIEIDRAALASDVVYRAFTRDHLAGDESVDVGTALLVVGFPLGFHDTLHQLPVARHAIVASCFGLRFQGEGYFLTDARTHRGMSGAPVVMKMAGDGAPGGLPWVLLGVHSARLDVGTRDTSIDEALGLNCSWYADMLLPLS
ncbi:MAG: serine protease, partial [Gammaproteobacteria bacterium]|nr:serine protease [Gammaproteobacteria bacterium]